jgi:hypothetical protein
LALSRYSLAEKAPSHDSWRRRLVSSLMGDEPGLARSTLENIRNTRTVHAVVLGGKLIDERARQAMLAEMAGARRK